MVGFAMIILTVIFFGAFFYRKKVVEMITDTLTFNTAKEKHVDPTRMLRTARNMGLTYMAYKRWAGRGSGKPKEDYSPIKPHPDDYRHVDSGRFPEYFDPEEEKNPYEGENPNYENLQITDGKDIDNVEFTSYYEDEFKSRVWEGQPPEGYPFRSLTGKTSNDYDTDKENLNNNDENPKTNNVPDTTVETGNGTMNVGHAPSDHSDPNNNDENHKTNNVPDTTAGTGNRSMNISNAPSEQDN
ncbi:hypothetical protein Dtox_2506 [Desulfofarcimen acetoxidans DSM 771]|uniref:Uncharacterized protein n=1 Tax=Desulfofarcimen acetoxidans (strain ATCC 49208 / DSM 771 / KCTC 5769 / VKM B-1644 / 5575) TaxID=485916 RepID=C8W0Q6_DESAS|nr:hypothetical protein [Desulfofarcimen acetoxidans]ACV63311.1 hypothetical protein Dtox_2506 [Desulfofarcimen acetoxidans DSM 771]